MRTRPPVSGYATCTLRGKRTPRLCLLGGGGFALALYPALVEAHGADFRRCMTRWSSCYIVRPAPVRPTNGERGLGVDMIIIVLWFALAIVIALAANGRGRSGAAWFILAVCLSPLIAGILLAILPDRHLRVRLEDVRRSRGVPIDDAELKRNVRRGRWSVRQW
jgi:hypothetical protein